MDKNIEYFKSEELYHITGWLIWDKSTPIVKSTPVSDEKVVFKFCRTDYGYWKFIEKNIITVYTDPITRLSIVSYNFVLLRSFIIKFLLKSWSLPIELIFNNHGILTDECFSRVMNVYPSIMRYFVERIESLLFMDDCDRELIAKQSILLFGKAGIGVRDPHEAVSSYCDLTGFWEKFGLNYFDMQNIPQDVYVKLRTVLMHEVDIKNQQMKNTQNAKPKSSKGKMLDYQRF